MVVLSIMGLTAAVVLPRLGGFEGRDFRVKVSEAKAILEHARRTAIVQGQAVEAVFLQRDKEEDAGRSGITQKHVSDSDLLWQSEDIRLSFNQQRLDYGETAHVTFFPEGGSTAGDLVFQKGALSLHVHIDSMTGRIRFVDDEHS